MKELAGIFLGYGLGSIPFGFIIGRLKNVDLKATGSGSTGATNVGRVLGPKYFILVFLLDGVKGAAAVFLANLLGFNTYLTGLAAIIGHIFTPFLKFRGGKGVATTIGVFLTLFPKIFLLAFGAWIIVYLLSFYVSLASLAFALVLGVSYNLFSPGPWSSRIIVIVTVILIIVAHLPNIQRLIKGSEPKTFIWGKR